MERDGIKNKSTPRAFLGIHRRGWLLVGGGNMHVASVDGLSETRRRTSEFKVYTERVQENQIHSGILWTLGILKM